MSEKPVAKIEYLKILAQFLGVIEKLLPAFLISWNNYLQQKNSALKFTIEKMEVEKKVHAFKEKIAKDDSDPIAIINTVLADPDDSGASDNKSKL